LKWPLVRVSWVDSYGPRGWCYMRDALEERTLAIESIGWLIQDTDERVTIAAHVQTLGVADGDPSMDGIMTIPKCAITNLQEWELVDEHQ
jgi:hypothetical protein